MIHFLSFLDYKVVRAKFPNLPSLQLILLILFIHVYWRSKPLLIVHGNQREAKAELQREAEPYPNIQMFAVSEIYKIVNTYKNTTAGSIASLSITINIIIMWCTGKCG